MKGAVGTLCLTLLGVFATGADLLTLEQAQKLALEQGWQMRMNAVDDTARNWQKKNVIAGYMPQLSYGATLLRMDDSTVSRSNMFFTMSGNFPGIDKLKTRQSTLSHEVMLIQPITNGGAEIIAIKMANHTKIAQKSGYEADRQDLVLTVTRQYFDCISTLEQQQILRADRQWAEKNLEAAKIRVEGGMMTRTDLMRWQQQVTEKYNALVLMDAVASINRATLASTLGMDPSTAPEWRTESFEQFENRFNTAEDLPESSIDNNARLTSIEGYRALADDNRKMTVAAALPKINAFAKYSRDQGWDDPGEVFTKAGTWVGGISLSVPIFSGFRSSTKYREAKYDAFKTEIALQRTKSQLTINLIRIKEFYKASRLTAQSARELMKLTQENMDIMTTRYNAGQHTQMDLLEMNKAVVATKFNYISKVLETLLFGSNETWGPMASTIVVGMVTGVLGTFFVIPCVYGIVDNITRKLGFAMKLEGE